MDRSTRAHIGALALGLLASAAVQANRYTIVDLGVSRYPSQINNVGFISKTYQLNKWRKIEHPYAWRGEHWQLLDEKMAGVTSIDEDGTAGGYLAAKDNHPTVPYTWTSNGQRHRFDLPEGTPYGAVVRISNSRVVGSFSAESRDGCFLGSSHGGATVDIGAPGSGANACYPAGINASGQVIGYSNDNHSFIWEKGIFTDLGTLPGGTVAWAAWINDSGQVVGMANFAGVGYHAFLWKDGVMTDIGNSPEFLYSSAQSINDLGAVVGSATYLHGGPIAVRFENGETINLNDEVPKWSGWYFTNATCINDSGVIIGDGTYKDKAHGFMLVPRAEE